MVYTGGIFLALLTNRILPATGHMPIYMFRTLHAPINTVHHHPPLGLKKGFDSPWNQGQNLLPIPHFLSTFRFVYTEKENFVVLTIILSYEMLSIEARAHIAYSS